MNYKYLLGVDFGGGASKATLLRDDGKIVVTASREYPTYYPHDGWAEQNPEEVYDAFVSNVREIIKNSSINPDDIAALCLDAATHTAVLLDEDDNLVRNSIYWTDKRSAKESDYLFKKYNDEIMSLSYNTPSPLWTLPQMMWLRENEQENFKKINKIMFVKDYIRYRIVNEFVVDSIEAAGSMMMDVKNNCWSKKLCDIAGISISQLPKIVEPTDIVGYVSEAAAKETGLSTKTCVIAGASDTVMEVYASGAIQSGQATIKLATAGRICFVTDKEYPDPMLINYRHVVGGKWYPGTATKSCAASYRWYRDVLGHHEIEQAKSKGISAYELMSEAAKDIPVGSSGLFFHPYLQGEITPYLDNDLKASFTGISSFHTKAHFNRAVLEGVAYSLLDCKKVIDSLGVNISKASIIGGGASSKLWRQIVSDMLGIELVKTKNNDSSLGSAMLAGVSVGIFSSFEESIEKCIEVETTIKPDFKNHKKYQKGYEIYRGIHDAMAPIYKQMASYQQFPEELQ